MVTRIRRTIQGGVVIPFKWDYLSSRPTLAFRLRGDFIPDAFSEDPVGYLEIDDTITCMFSGGN